MKKRIFITTNWNALETKVLPKAAPNRNGVTNGIDRIGDGEGKFNVLYYNERIKAFQGDEIDSEIVLIYDKKYNESIKVIRIDDEKKRDFLLRHSIPENVTPSYEDKFGKNVTTGEHERLGKNYPAVFKIIFDGENKKAERIIEFLFPTSEAILGKKLDLLHRLLVHPLDFAEANKQWIEIETTVESAKGSGINVSLATDENALTTFQNKVNGMNDPFDPDYIKALADLRDAILSS